MRKVKVILFLLMMFCYDGHTIFPDNLKGNILEIIGVQINIGESRIVDILRILGPSTKIHLGSQDEEMEDYSKMEYPEEDYIVLEYLREVTLRKKHKCVISFYADPNTSIVMEVVIRSATYFSDITVDEVKSVLGEPERVIRQSFSIIVDEIEALLSDCDDENGELESFLYPKKGIQVILDDKLFDSKGKEMQLRFFTEIIYSFDILKGKKTFPKCKQNNILKKEVK